MESETIKLNAKKANKQKSNSNELIERENINNTPFTIITMEGYSFGVLGEYRITEKNNSKEEIRKELEEITWNRIVQVLMILINKNL